MDYARCMTSKPADDVLVTVRRRWNDPASATARAASLLGLRLRSDPGSMCGPRDRPFLYARIWCDHLSGAGPLHLCQAASAPHELEVCILQRDNPPELYADLLERQRY